MGRSPVAAIVLAFLIVAFLAAMPGPAHAQEPEPTQTPTATLTPTATPGPDFVRLPLTSGHTVEVQYTVTFGEIAVAIAVLALVVVIALLAILLLPKVYL